MRRLVAVLLTFVTLLLLVPVGLAQTHRRRRSVNGGITVFQHGRRHRRRQSLIGLGSYRHRHRRRALIGAGAGAAGGTAYHRRHRRRHQHSDISR